MNAADKNIIETAISALERDLRTERTTRTVRGEEFPAIVYDGFPYAIHRRGEDPCRRRGSHR